MARQFNELVKDFNNIRLYAQDFYINGYKQREEFHSKSPRSYDNERRRIESYLTEFIEWEQSGQGKSLRLELQQEQLDTNPFFRLWQTKSFTKNDIFLHFTLLDCLIHGPQSLPQLTALIHNDYLSQFVEQVSLTDMTIRHKVKEYCQLGIIEEFEQEKRVVFQLKPRFELSEDMIDVLHFFKEMAPGGVIGQFLLNQQPPTASPFVFKHHFIVHSLDEQIVLTILEAIDQKNRLRLAQGEKESLPSSQWPSTSVPNQVDTT